MRKIYLEQRCAIPEYEGLLRVEDEQLDLLPPESFERPEDKPSVFSLDLCQFDGTQSLVLSDLITIHSLEEVRALRDALNAFIADREPAGGAR